MLKRTAKSCGPDAPTLASSLRSRVGPTVLRQNISVDDGGKRARSPGRARHKPLKPLRAGTSGDSGVLVYSCAFYQYQVHTRLRVPRAPGVPHALFGRKINQRLGRIARREVASVCLELRLAVIASEAKQSISPRKGRMDCFASLAMTALQLSCCLKIESALLLEMQPVAMSRPREGMVHTRWSTLRALPKTAAFRVRLKA